MFTALFSFLGGSVFRMIFGEVSAFLTKRQDNAHEIQLMTLQSELEDKRAERLQAGIVQQHQLGIQTIQVQGEQDIARLETQGWATAVSEALKPTGNWFVDLWNGTIRPYGATIALILWTLKVYSQGWKMDDYDMNLVAVILGFFYASREMNKRGK